MFPIDRFQFPGIVDDVCRTGSEPERSGHFGVADGPGEDEDIGFRIELLDDLVDAFHERTGHIEIRDIALVIVLVDALRDTVCAQDDLSVVGDLRLIFFEVETHSLEALIDSVIVYHLAHRVDVGLCLQVLFDLVDRPFHTETESGVFRDDDLYISSLSHNSWTFPQMISAAAFSSFFFREPGVNPSSS